MPVKAALFHVQGTCPVILLVRDRLSLPGLCELPAPLYKHGNYESVSGKIKVMLGSFNLDEFDQELLKGQEARRAGFEGRARVCARRAAGAVIRAYLARRDLPAPGSGAYDLLIHFQTLPDIPARAREAAQRLAMRVDEDFRLPGEIDLLDEARQLAQGLEAALADDHSGENINTGRRLGGK